MKTSEYRDNIKSKTKLELESELRDLKSELFKLRFQLATSQLENPMKIKEVKLNIARVKTVMRENETKGGNTVG